MKKEEAIRILMGYSHTPEERAALETLIPELRESEDERIRKEIIEFLQNTLIKRGIKDGNDKAVKWIAYLEKQKYDRMKPIYDAKESFESALDKAWNDYHNGYENVDKLEDDYVECAHAKGFREGYLFGLEKQKEITVPNSTELIEMWHKAKAILKEKDFRGDEWRLAQNAFMDGFARGTCIKFEKQKEQKSVEWSEEDEAAYNAFMCEVVNEKMNPTIDQIKWLRSICDRLKSLRPQYHGDITMTEAYKMGLEAGKASSWKPSEQEKGALRTAIHILTDERSFPKAAAQLQNILDAFEGKESRKDWKPSEEQIYSLGTVVKGYDECTVGSVGYNLKEMYDELKKLM